MSMRKKGRVEEREEEMENIKERDYMGERDRSVDEVVGSGEKFGEESREKKKKTRKRNIILLFIFG